MLECEVLKIAGIDEAIHGMRNPMNSWNLSDSYIEEYVKRIDEHKSVLVQEFKCGDNDLDLMNRLYLAGTEHRKYLRMIQVWCDITAPLYWWKEFDTYKIGTVSNSCSTMHKIHEKAFTLDDFSHEHLSVGEYSNTELLISVLDCLNVARELFLETKDKKYWWQMIQLLPSSYNQKRTVNLNYEVIANIVRQRTGHKLDEWSQLIDVFSTLPYVKEIGVVEHD